MQGGLGGVRQVVARGGRVTRAATRLREADTEAGGSCWFCLMIEGYGLAGTNPPHVHTCVSFIQSASTVCTLLYTPTKRAP